MAPGDLLRRPSTKEVRLPPDGDFQRTAQVPSFTFCPPLVDDDDADESGDGMFARPPSVQDRESSLSTTSRTLHRSFTSFVHDDEDDPLPESPTVVIRTPRTGTEIARESVQGVAGRLDTIRSRAERRARRESELMRGRRQRSKESRRKKSSTLDSLALRRELAAKEKETAVLEEQALRALVDAEIAREKAQDAERRVSSLEESVVSLASRTVQSSWRASIEEAARRSSDPGDTFRESFPRTKAAEDVPRMSFAAGAPGRSRLDDDSALAHALSARVATSRISAVHVAREEKLQGLLDAATQQVAGMRAAHARELAGLREQLRRLRAEMESLTAAKEAEAAEMATALAAAGDELQAVRERHAAEVHDLTAALARAQQAEDMGAAVATSAQPIAADAEVAALREDVDEQRRQVKVLTDKVSRLERLRAETRRQALAASTGSAHSLDTLWSLATALAPEVDEVAARLPEELTAGSTAVVRIAKELAEAAELEHLLVEPDKVHNLPHIVPLRMIVAAMHNSPEVVEDAGEADANIAVAIFSPGEGWTARFQVAERPAAEALSPWLYGAPHPLVAGWGPPFHTLGSRRVARHHPSQPGRRPHRPRSGARAAAPAREAGILRTFRFRHQRARAQLHRPPHRRQGPGSGVVHRRRSHTRC